MAAAVNSNTLFEIDSGISLRGNLQARPVDTENPPIPCGHASVMVMLVGSRAVIRLKLIPECALEMMVDQNDNNLESRELILRVERLCFPI